MSFTRSIINISIMSALALNSSNLFAKSVSLNKTLIDEELVNEESVEGEDSLEDFYGDEDFVSIATGNKKLIHKAPGVTSVITREEIDNLGATHLDEVLERIPGLHVGTSNLSRLDPIYSIRGIQTGFNPQVLVLLNGVDFKNSFSEGLPYTFRYPLSNVERIEVIRGPGSALYGADAFSGVINIITTQVENKKIAIGGRLGSFDSHDIWINAGHKIDKGYLRFSLENQVSDGDKKRSAQTDLQTVFDNVFGTSASLAPIALDSRYDVLNIQADVKWHDFQWENWYWQQTDGGVGPGGAQALDPSGFQNVELFRTLLKYQTDISNNAHINSYVSWMKTNNDSFFNLFPDNAVLPIGADGNINFSNIAGIVLFKDGYIGNPKSVEKNMHAHLSFSWSGWNSHNITTAVGYSALNVKAQEFKNFGPGIIDGSQPVVDGTLTDVTGTPFIYIPDVSRNNRYVLIQDEWKISNDWELTLGTRYDNYSDFGSSINPRAALVWQTSNNMTTKVLFGSAFRAPSFNELFLINNPSALGNPNVKPEKIDTWELSFEYRPRFDVRISTNVYRYKATDLIDKLATSEGLKTENVRDQNGYGLESEVQWKINEKLTAYANYSWQHSEDDKTGVRVADAPKQLFYLDIHYDLNEQWQLGTQLWWVGSRTRAISDMREPVDSDILSNIKISWNILSGIKLHGVVKNVFDTKASEPSNGSVPNDFQREGRSLWLEAEYSF